MIDRGRLPLSGTFPEIHSFLMKISAEETGDWTDFTIDTEPWQKQKHEAGPDFSR